MSNLGIMASHVSSSRIGPHQPTYRWLLKSTGFLVAESINLSGATAGRLLVATMSSRSSAGATITPSGWTVVGAQLGDHGSSSPTLTMWARVATGTEGATAFWDATYDANKILEVAEYNVTLISGLTVIGNTPNDSVAGTGTSCPLIPAAVTQTNVLWIAGLAVRDIINNRSQVQVGWNIPGMWDSNVNITDGNTTWLHTNASYVNNSSEPICQPTWTNGQRYRGRVIGLEVGAL